MDLTGIVSELRGQKEQLDQAIQVLEKLERDPATLQTSQKAPRRRRPFSAESRRKMAEAQKRRWDAKRGQSGSAE